MIDTAKLRDECAYLIDVGEGMDCYTVLSLIDALEKAQRQARNFIDTDDGRSLEAAALYRDLANMIIRSCSDREAQDRIVTALTESAEAMRAKCEEIARDWYHEDVAVGGRNVAWIIADAIAALGKGEG